MGAVVIVIILFDVAFAQGALPKAVNVKVTLPADISAALGVYVAPANEVALVIVPALPLEVHSTLEKLVAVAPVVILTPVALEQTVKGVPAEAVAGALTVIITSLTAAVHGALLTVQRMV